MIIRVHGTPAPQGSKIKNRYGAMYESSAKVKPWREAVKHAALGAIEALCIRREFARRHEFTGPVRFSATFTFPRPKSHYRTGRNAHLLRDDAPRLKISKPDMDKLLRSTWDALTDAGVWRDDSQVAQLGTVEKVYGDAAGAELTVEVAR